MPRPRNIWEVLAQTAESVPGAFDKQREGQNKRTLADLEMMLEQGRQSNRQATLDQREEMNRQNRMQGNEQELYDRLQKTMDIEAEDVERRADQPMKDAKLREQELRNRQLMKELGEKPKPTKGKDVPTSRDTRETAFKELHSPGWESPTQGALDSASSYLETGRYPEYINIPGEGDKPFKLDMNMFMRELEKGKANTVDNLSSEEQRELELLRKKYGR